MTPLYLINSTALLAAGMPGIQLLSICPFLIFLLP